MCALGEGKVLKVNNPATIHGRFAQECGGNRWLLRMKVRNGNDIYKAKTPIDNRTVRRPFGRRPMRAVVCIAICC